MLFNEILTASSWKVGGWGGSDKCGVLDLIVLSNIMPVMKSITDPLFHGSRSCGILYSRYKLMQTKSRYRRTSSNLSILRLRELIICFVAGTESLVNEG